MELDIKELKEFFSSLVQVMEKNGNYADVLLLKETSLSISTDKSDTTIDNEEDMGVKLRLFDGEFFHIFSSSGINRELLKQKAVEFSTLPKKEKVNLIIDTEKLSKHFTTKPKIDPATISLKEKADLVKSLQAKINNADKLIINARAVYSEGCETKIFVNRYKQLSYIFNSCFLWLMPYVQADNGDVRYHYKGHFSHGYEVTKIREKVVNDLIKMTLAISRAGKLEPGKYTCILSPDTAGLLAHESFGHGMESDTIYKGRAKAIEYLGKRIAPGYVSIIDNPAFPMRHGSFFFDDEGMLAKPTYLIKNGIVSDPITDTYSLSRLNEEGIKICATANARAESFDHKCYARMSNTYFGEGKTKAKNMIKHVKDGLFLHYSAGGMEDPKGWNVQIQGIVAEEIKNGKLTGKLFYEVGMTGYLPTILANILAVGDKLFIRGAGRCGKGHKEWVRVSEGGPHLLIKEVDLA
jgi:TldD protein